MPTRAPRCRFLGRIAAPPARTRVRTGTFPDRARPLAHRGTDPEPTRPAKATSDRDLPTWSNLAHATTHALRPQRQPPGAPACTSSAQPLLRLRTQESPRDPSAAAESDLATSRLHLRGIVHRWRAPTSDRVRRGLGLPPFEIVRGVRQRPVSRAHASPRSAGPSARCRFGESGEYLAERRRCGRQRSTPRTFFPRVSLPPPDPLAARRATAP